MKRNFAKFTLGIGAILFLLQFFMIACNYIDGSYYMTEQFAVVEQVTFGSFVAFIWPAILGIIVLFAALFLRFNRKPAPILEVFGLVLWGFQIYRLYDIIGDPVMLAGGCVLGLIAGVLVMVGLGIDLAKGIGARMKNKE